MFDVRGLLFREMKKVFEQLISGVVKPRLVQNGFKVSGNTFRRQESDFLLIFDVWKSTWHTANDITFWFEIGAFSPSFYEFMFDEKPKANIRTNQCTLRLQAGSILRKGVPCYNYQLLENTVENVQNEIISDLDNAFIPLLNKLKNIEDILILGDYGAHTMEKLFVAFSLAEKGKSLDAKMLIDEYLNAAKYPKNWVDRIVHESKRLNILYFIRGRSLPCCTLRYTAS